MNFYLYAKLHGLTVYCLTRALLLMVRNDLRVLRESYPETEARIGLAMCGHDPCADVDPDPEYVLARDTGREVFYLDATYIDLEKKH